MSDAPVLSYSTPTYRPLCVCLYWKTSNEFQPEMKKPCPTGSSDPPSLSEKPREEKRPDTLRVGTRGQILLRILSKRLVDTSRTS